MTDQKNGCTRAVGVGVMAVPLGDTADARNARDATGWSDSGAVSPSSSLRTRRGDHPSPETTTTAEKARPPHAESESEVRIEQIRRRYRQQERILVEEIARLEQTYRIALAELDAEQQQQSENDDGLLVDGNRDWETGSEYPPTEPRGMSRTPSPVLVR
jgi:hypothetical protein